MLSKRKGVIAIFAAFPYSVAMRNLMRKNGFPLACAAAAARCVFVALLFALSAGGGSAAGGEIDSRALRRIVEERRGALRIQTEFPSETSNQGNGGYARSSMKESPVQVSPVAASTMLWTALGVLVAVILFTVYQNLRLRSRDKNSETRGERTRTDKVRARMDSAREESDVLAERGDYAAAMHVLLLNSVEEMRRRLGIRIAQSLTSREILARSGLEEDARACLGDIIHRVEISWFGAHLPGSDDYARCRASFVALAGILGRGGRS